MPYEKKKKFIVNVLFYAIIAAVIFLLVKYVLKWIMPFAVAFGVSAIINPFADKVSANFKVKKRFAAVFSTFIFYGIAVGLAVLVGFGLYNALKNLFSSMPYIYETSIAPTISSVMLWTEDFLADIDPALSRSLQDFASNFAANLGSTVSGISVKAIGWLSGYLTGIPFFIAAVLISVIATFFISGDYESIKAFIVRQIPQKWHIFLKDVKTHSLATVTKYIKSYALIMGITFFEVSLALWLLGVDNFVVIALIIAVFDIIPICGSGGILIPWAIFAIVQGRLAFGIGMLIAYAIITVIRQIIEPKIIGDQVGLPSIVTLMAMFLGVKFMGAFGLFAFPIALVIVKNLNDSGRIKLFK